MKVIADRLALLEGLKAVSAVIKARSPKPILQCVRMEATGEALILYATDLESAMQWTLRQVQVEQTGEMLANADLLVRAVGDSAGETISIAVVEEKCVIRDNSGVVRLPTGNVKDFPPAGDRNEITSFTISAAAVAEGIRQAAISLSDADTRYAFSGMLFEITKGKLAFAATEGRTLCKVGLGKVSAKDGQSIVAMPRTAEKFCDGHDGEITVGLGNGRCWFSLPDAILTLPLIEGSVASHRLTFPLPRAIGWLRRTGGVLREAT